MAYVGPCPQSLKSGSCRGRYTHSFGSIPLPLGLAVHRVGATSHPPLQGTCPPVVNGLWTSGPKTWLPFSTLQTLGIGENEVRLRVLGRPRPGDQEGVRLSQRHVTHLNYGLQRGGSVGDLSCSPGCGSAHL